MWPCPGSSSFWGILVCEVNGRGPVPNQTCLHNPYDASIMMRPATLIPNTISSVKAGEAIWLGLRPSTDKYIDLFLSGCGVSSRRFRPLACTQIMGDQKWIYPTVMTPRTRHWLIGANLYDDTAGLTLWYPPSAAFSITPFHMRIADWIDTSAVPRM